MPTTEPERALPAPDEDRGTHLAGVTAELMERETRVRHELADTAEAVAGTFDRIAAGKERAAERGGDDIDELQAHALRARRFADGERREAVRLRAEPPQTRGRDPEHEYEP